MKRLLSMLILLTLVAAPLHVFAQDEPDMEEFVSEDGLLTMLYPADWFVAEGTDLPFGGAVVMNTEEALERYTEGEDPEEGDRLIMVALFPLEFFALFGAELPDEPTILELTTTFAAMFTEPEEPAAGDTAPEVTVELGEPEEIELGEDLTAGLVTVSSEEEEGAFIVRDSGTDPAFAYLVVAYSMPGDFTDEQLELATAIAASVDYTGEPEAMLSALMGAPEDGGDETGAELDGATLVETRCSTCHTTDRIFAADKDAAGWASTVDRMIDYGAQLTPDERQTVIDYLSGAAMEGAGDSMGAALDGATLVETRCSLCHGTDQIYAADMDEEGWTNTVDRMIDYGAQLTETERQTVIDYLVATQ